MIVYFAIIAVQVFCVVDVIRHGRNSLWIMALIFLPVASTIAYFIVEVLPRLQHNRHIRDARQALVEKLDPERELRAAREALDIAVEHRLKRVNRQRNAADAPMYDWAMTELARLRG
jgi:hypothetical protein